jgi:hypothetical protein
MQEVVDEIESEHQEIMQKIKEFQIFDDNQTLMSESFELPFEVSKDEVGDLFHQAVFFQVIPGKVYFFLMDATFLCIYSDIMARKDIDRDERIQSLRCISFEEFIEIVPKEVAKKYLYHIDFFQEHLKVIEL